jgi:hypothetical protein
VLWPDNYQRHQLAGCAAWACCAMLRFTTTSPVANCHCQPASSTQYDNIRHDCQKQPGDDQAPSCKSCCQQLELTDHHQNNSTLIAMHSAPQPPKCSILHNASRRVPPPCMQVTLTSSLHSSRQPEASPGLTICP